MITKSAISISAQFNISPLYSFMVQNQIIVSLCLSLLWSTKRSTIPATAWLLVESCKTISPHLWLSYLQRDSEKL